MMVEARDTDRVINCLLLLVTISDCASQDVIDDMDDSVGGRDVGEGDCDAVNFDRFCN